MSTAQQLMEPHAPGANPDGDEVWRVCNAGTAARWLLDRHSGRDRRLRPFLIAPDSCAESAEDCGRQPHPLEEFARWIVEGAETLDAARKAKKK